MSYARSGRPAPTSRWAPSSASARGFGEDLRDAPEIEDLLVAMQRLPGAQPAMRQLVRAVTRLRGARRQIALTEEDLARIDCPVQLVWGGRDAFGGAGTGQRMADAIPDAELHVIPEAGHLPWVRSPEQVGWLASAFLRRQFSEAAARV